MSRVIRDRYFAQRLTVPAGTLSTAPTTIPFETPNLILVACELEIPDGHVGQTGFALDYQGHRILPWAEGVAWIQGNDTHATFRVGFEVDGVLSFVLYNEGNFDHSFYVRLQMAYLPDVRTAGAPLALVV